MSTVTWERRREIVRAARSQRNAEIWKLITKALRQWRWIVANRGW